MKKKMIPMIIVDMVEMDMDMEMEMDMDMDMDMDVYCMI